MSDRKSPEKIPSYSYGTFFSLTMASNVLLVASVIVFTPIINPAQTANTINLPLIILLVVAFSFFDFLLIRQCLPCPKCGENLIYKMPLPMKIWMAVPTKCSSCKTWPWK